MLSTIISIGDELLIGQTLNSNASWMAQELNKIGVNVVEMLTVADEKVKIIDVLDRAKKKSDLILITGGLGPTKDDLTKQSLCDYFGAKLILNETILNDVKNLFQKRGLPLTELNRGQAMVPDKCTPIRNYLGTAPGLWFEKEVKIAENSSPQMKSSFPTANCLLIISLPGVPFEMKAMISDFVIPEIKRKFKLPVIIHKNILTAGIGESFLADKIKDWENNLPQYIKLAYLPSLGIVKLRMTTCGEDEKKLHAEINSQVEQLKTIIPEYIFGYDDDTIVNAIGKLLKEKNATVATAESCTGGFLAHLITSIAGSSDYFKGSIISYSNDIKKEVLEVKKETLEKFGVVSEETCKEMLQGVLKIMKSDYAISITGIIGPTGGTEETPVGTVWVGVGTQSGFITKKFQFPFTRLQNIEVTAVNALNLLRKFLLRKII